MLCHTVNRLQYSIHIAFISTWKAKTYITHFIAYSLYCSGWELNLQCLWDMSVCQQWTSGILIKKNTTPFIWALLQMKYLGRNLTKYVQDL